jgi:hypothetical protein
VEELETGLEGIVKAALGIMRMEMTDQSIKSLLLKPERQDKVYHIYIYIYIYILQLFLITFQV